MAGDELSGFESFCGSVLWDENVTWYTPDPDFTPCFHKSILAWTPFALFLLLLPFEVVKCRASLNRRIPWNFYNLLKFTLTLACVAVALTDLVMVISNDRANADIDYVTGVVFVLSYASSAALLYLTLYYGVRTSGTQFTFYAASIVCAGLELRTIAKHHKDQSKYPFVDPEQNDNLAVLFSLQYACICLLFLLNLFADAQPRDYEEAYAKLPNPIPQISASFPSKLIFEWCTPLLWKGWRKPLTRDDLWDIDPKHTSAKLVPLFDAHFEASKQRARNGKYAKVETNPVSMLPALLYTFGPSFFFASALKIVADLLALASPQVGYSVSQKKLDITVEQRSSQLFKIC